MTANLPLLRPLGIIAGGLGSFQAITWGILSLLGILAYTDDIHVESPSNPFQRVLLNMYFNRTVPAFGELNNMTPGTVVVWTSIYFATSVIWLVISGLLFLDSYDSKFTNNIINRWVTVSAIVAAIDIAGTVAFGVDYDRAKIYLDKQQVPYPFATEILLAPLFMMIMCARGFILWIMNVGLVIYLGVAARKLYRKGSPHLLQEPENLSRHPSFNSHYYNSMGANLHSSSKVDSSSQGRPNSTFQPDSIFAWDTQSPTVGNQQPSQRDFPPQNAPGINEVVNPIKLIPRVGKPVPTSGAFVPTPKPDYSPRTRRPVRHEPYMYETPTRSVLKNPNAQERTYF